ncbi:MAG: hypothetical protein ACTSSH_00860 [Candidatus Heimdallarchaeota archaeon]
MKPKQIVIVSLISSMIFLLPLSNVNAFTWKLTDDVYNDIEYYDTEGVFQYECSEHTEIDIHSMELDGSNIIIDLTQDFPNNSINYMYAISIRWETLPGPNTLTSGYYGENGTINYISTQIFDEEGYLDDNTTFYQITHFEDTITFPVPLFEDLPFALPDYAECQTVYQPDGGLTEERYIDRLNGTFTRTPSAPGFTYWVFITSSITLLAIFSYKKKRND